jgi:hypothetical protein
MSIVAIKMKSLCGAQILPMIAPKIVKLGLFSALSADPWLPLSGLSEYTAMFCDYDKF